MIAEYIEDTEEWRAYFQGFEDGIKIMFLVVMLVLIVTFPR